jgi:TrmH family RNA methyltransferase
MVIGMITSPSNQLIKLARALHQRKARRESGLFLVEGILHVGEAIAAGWEIEHILYAPDLLDSRYAAELITQQKAQGVRCEAVSPQVFGLVAAKDNPQGILAVVLQRKWALEQVSRNEVRLGVALVSPQDPGNVGTILRTVDAVSADALFLLEGGTDPFHPSAVRASMGALFWKPVIQTPFASLLLWAKRENFRLIGTSAHGSLDYRELDREPGSDILMLGSEQKGLSEAQAAACDILVRIPMRGRISSLNLAVAAGVLLYALAERQMGEMK